MKISHLIEMLERYYDKDDYVVVAWWDKAWAEATLERTFTKEEWEYVVGRSDITTDFLADAVADEIESAASLIGE